jgi:hypothetical protein
MIGRWTGEIAITAGLALAITVALYYFDHGVDPPASEIMVIIVGSWLAVKGVGVLIRKWKGGKNA